MDKSKIENEKRNIFTLDEMMQLGCIKIVFQWRESWEAGPAAAAPLSRRLAMLAGFTPPNEYEKKGGLPNVLLRIKPNGNILYTGIKEKTNKCLANSLFFTK